MFRELLVTHVYNDVFMSLRSTIGTLGTVHKHLLRGDEKSGPSIFVTQALGALKKLPYFFSSKTQTVYMTFYQIDTYFSWERGEGAERAEFLWGQKCVRKMFVMHHAPN